MNRSASSTSIVTFRPSPRRCRLAPLAGLLALAVTALAAPPVAMNDQVTVPASWTNAANLGPIDVAVLANDTDADGHPLTVTAVSQPKHGSVATDGVKVTYTPPAAPGERSKITADQGVGVWFTYTVGDGHGGTATAHVALANQPAPAGGPFCFPVRYRTRSHLIDPLNNYYERRELFFDLGLNALRVEGTQENPNETPTEVTLLYRPGAGTLHRRFGTGPCTVGAFTQNFTATCFAPANTPYLGTVGIGRATAHRWLAPHPDGTHSIYVVTLHGAQAHPVQQMHFTGSQLQQVVNYQDFRVQTNAFPAATFAVPGDCP
jgi:hypothetical protein